MKKNSSKQNKRKTAKKLISYVLKSRGAVALAIIFSVITATATFFSPYLVGRAIDTVTSYGADFQRLAPFLFGLLGVFIGGAVSGWLLSTLANRIAMQTAARLRKDSMEKINRLPIEYIDSKPYGDTVSRFTNDTDAVSQGVMQVLMLFFSGVIIMAGCIVMMILLDFWIAMVIIVVAPLAVLIAAFISKRTGKLFRENQRLMGEYTAKITELTSGQKLIKAFGYEEQAVKTTDEISQRAAKCYKDSMFFSSTVNPSSRLVSNVAYAMVGLVGGLLAIAEGSLLTAGIISSLLIYTAQFTKPLNELTAAATQIQAATAAADRVFEFLELSEEVDESEKPDLVVTRGNISFQNVDFSYSKDTPLIENFCLDVSEGSLVAIVGRTGAGKSTLLNLLMRFYDIDNGRILIDNVDIRDTNRASVRRSFAMVLQDAWIFGGTIAENIAFGQNLSREEIVEAARNAHAHRFITRLQDGYDTVLSPESNALSQGEKQLLTIARAMAQGAPMLILDEATSSIDTRTELHIQNALEKLAKGKTGFIIAHRLSTIKNADIIIVLANGKVVETGNHAELLKKEGFYYNMYHSQFMLSEKSDAENDTTQT